MKSPTIFTFFILLQLGLSAQVTPGLAGYQITDDVKLECTEVKNQSRTGTCWSFATTSFLESELIRQGNDPIDLAEMYTVRKTYEDKANNYIFRQSKANFSEGSLAHDVIRAASEHGIMPQSAFTGLLPGQSNYDHSELSSGLKGFLDGVLENERPSKHWRAAFSGILDAYMGSYEDSFTYEEKTYTPETFAAAYEFSADNYVNLTSFTHHPFDTEFILEIPDNYSNGEFYNLPINDLKAIVDHALAEGYSVAWDGDVSEKGFSSSQGLAILPVDTSREDVFETPGEEIAVNQTMRQEAFENFDTTDDHLMHIVGTAQDVKGNKYYKIKNSWGERGPFKGYLYMSEAYLLMKTVSVTLHRDGVPKTFSSKL